MRSRNALTPLGQHDATAVCIKLLVLLFLSSQAALAQSTITTIVGGVNPVNGAQATTISFASSEAVIPDGAGGFYFSVRYPQNRVYRVASDGTMTIVAGNGTEGFSGDGGPATSAQLNSPSGIALDAGGNLLIADSGNSRIRKVTPGGTISTVAGTGVGGFGGDGGPAASAQLRYPRGIAVDGSGNVLIADSDDHRIRKITPAGTITTVAGTGSSGFSGDNGPAVSAQLSYPIGIAIDSSGVLFIADSNNARIRKVATNGAISTVAGSSGCCGFSGDGGPATSARLSPPWGVAVDANGNILIADTSNSRIRQVNSQGIISTVAGTGNFGFAGDGGLAVSAQLYSPAGITVDTSGSLLIADTENHRIRKVSSAGIISTVAGNGTQGFGGDGGPAVSALLNSPSGLALDASDNLFIADRDNSRIRKVTPTGVISTFAGNGTGGFTGDGGPATSARLNLPSGVAVAPDGSVYIADCNDRLRKVGPGGDINTFATSNWLFCIYDYYYYYYGNTQRGGVAVDAAGNVFVADTFHYRVFKVNPQGQVSPVAGTGTYGFAGDGGPAIAARITEPWGVTLDTNGNLFIADAYNNRIRKVTPAGIISTVVGVDQGGFSGDGGPAVSAQLNFPTSVAMDASGNLFIADTSNQRIRRVNPEGIITTVAGNGLVGVIGDGGPPTNARLDSPIAVAVDTAGNLYIADQNNHRIRKATFALTVPTLAKISSNLAAAGLTVSVVLEGTSFSSPLTIDAGNSITVTDVRVLSETQATATFAIASNATTGIRNVSVTTGLGTSGTATFEIVPPFPDLSISSSQGNLEAGFNGSFTVNISNKGTAPTAGSIVVTDTLPTGYTFVSGTGTGWSCSSSNQDVTCSNPQALGAGDTTALLMTVAAGSNASHVTHSLTVSVDGDLLPTNNSFSDDLNVRTPSINFTINPSTLAPGGQATVTLSLSSAFTHDMTGTLTLGFSSSAIIPADDPAIQFSGGGRTVNFTVPANTTLARFTGNAQPGAIAFQTGTVAGTIAFTVALQSGTIQAEFSNSRAISRRGPTVHSARKDDVTTTTLNLGITVSSTPREITQLVLSFQGNPAVTTSCGSVSGCTAAGNTLTLDVKSLFETWFKSDSQFGSLSTLHVPLTLAGKFSGSIQISLRNSSGTSNTLAVPVP